MPKIIVLSILAFLTVSSTAQAATAPNIDRSTAQITRAEAVALLVSAQKELRPRVSRYREHMPPLPLFLDTKQTDWYAPYLEVAFDEGLIAGNLQRRFRPLEMLRVEEAVMLVTRMQERGAETPTLHLPAAGNHWYVPALQAALTGSMPVPSVVRPGQPLSRADFYAMLPTIGIAYPQAVAFVEPPPPPEPRRIIISSPPAQSATPLRPRSIARAVTPVRVAGTPVGGSSAGFHISLPTLGINDLTVTHPSDPFSHNGLLTPLRQGVGHLFSYPGTNGKILIYGHSSGYPWDVSSYTKIFRQINRLNPGDRVSIAYNGTTHVYEVTFKESVPAADINAYRNGGQEELILYTCWPPDSIRERYLVHARPVEKVAAR